MPNAFATTALAEPPPLSMHADVTLPRRTRFHPSPADWRDEVLYFLIVDRFSDAAEHSRPLLDHANRPAARPAIDGQPWRWDRWAESGAHRWQGGTLRGVRSKLDYLAGLGVTTLWISPVFKQRGHLDTYHGYGVQNFLAVDPRFGTARDLVDLVDAAHERGMRVILDIIFNHSGSNWVYPGGGSEPNYLEFPARYAFGSWLDRSGASVVAIDADIERGVWPRELQNPEGYTRAGAGNLGAGELDDAHAEHKRSDFFSLRDFALGAPGVLSDLADCYRYWIALTDCDGFRLDTLKHVSFEEGRNFCGTIKEFAANIGKTNFLLVGEIAGGDFAQDRFLDVLGRNLDAALDIGGMRITLQNVAKGLTAPQLYFGGFDAGDAEMGSHRNLGLRHVSILDDHDHVFGSKIRFSSEASSDRQVIAGVALQLFTLGIPCIYYGTEQSFAGPEASERRFLPGWNGGDHADRYLREAMFGPTHPRRAGRAGFEGDDVLDRSLPGFGPFGTAGAHCFDTDHSAYRLIAALNEIRERFPVLRVGRQYLRPTSLFSGPFGLRGGGELLAWSRILHDEEALCVVNTHGTARRGADVLVDASLNRPPTTMTVVANTEEIHRGTTTGTAHPAGSKVAVKRAADGTVFTEIRDVPAAGVLILVNRP